MMSMNRSPNASNFEGRAMSYGIGDEASYQVGNKFNVTRSLNIINYLEQEQRTILEIRMSPKPNLASRQICFLAETIRILTKVIKYTPKLKNLTIKEILQLSNKVVDLSENGMSGLD